MQRVYRATQKGAGQWTILNLARSAETVHACEYTKAKTGGEIDSQSYAIMKMVGAVRKVVATTVKRKQSKHGTGDRTMRIIDADALMPNAEYKGKNDFVSAQDIANAPTIDAVQVVRCKYCKRYYKNCDNKEIQCVTDPDWFCADGVRKDGINQCKSD